MRLNDVLWYSAVHQYDADLAAVEGRHQSLITDLRRSFEETTTSKEDMDKLQQDTDRYGNHWS